jgi:hypothetical protein
MGVKIFLMARHGACGLMINEKEVMFVSWNNTLRMIETVLIDEALLEFSKQGGMS